MQLRRLVPHRKKLRSLWAREFGNTNSHAHGVDALEHEPQLVRNPVNILRALSNLQNATRGKAVAKAKRRKLLGNPPDSPDKNTIGDEVISELLLANGTEDLIVVTNDETYQNNLPVCMM